jgi:hypothetical protein
MCATSYVRFDFVGLHGILMPFEATTPFAGGVAGKVDPVRTAEVVERQTAATHAEADRTGHGLKAFDQKLKIAL